MMKIYECYVDDGKSVFKAYSAAENKKQLLDVYGGNGDFIKIKDMSKDIFTDETPAYLRDVLLSNRFGDPETALIVALVEEFIKKTGGRSS